MPTAVVLPSTRPEPRARVLVAEDDLELRRMLSALLSADGYEVIEVADGRELLRYMTSLSGRSGSGSDGDGQALEPMDMRVPDLIISDICMPQVDGLSVLEQLRNADVGTPVVLMTAFANESICEQADELGAVTLLSKPFELDDLRMIVLNVAARNGAQRENENSVKAAV